MIVARGMVFSGFSTSPAGTEADSIPRNAHSVRAATALMLSPTGLLPGLKTRLSGLNHKRPMVAIASSGSSLMIVVITAMRPVLSTPRRLIRVTHHTSAIAVPPPAQWLLASTGKKPDR